MVKKKLPKKARPVANPDPTLGIKVLGYNWHPTWDEISSKAVSPVKLDLGCGSKKQPDHVGVDRIAFDGVDHVLELGRDKWPFEDGSVDEAYSSHCVEHLTAEERIHFVNELSRVLKPGSKCTLIVPHWASCRAYGDPTHQWPPIGEFWFYYLSRAWRDTEAPHTDVKHWDKGFDCDFEATWGYTLNPSPEIAGRNPQFQQFAVNHYREVVYDIHSTLTKKP